MGNNLFYKALAAIGTVGILGLPGNQIAMADGNKQTYMFVIVPDVGTELIPMRSMQECGLASSEVIAMDVDADGLRYAPKALCLEGGS